MKTHVILNPFAALRACSVKDLIAYQRRIAEMDSRSLS